MTTFEAGQRVRVNENYAKNIGPGVPPETLDETGAGGTVVTQRETYVEVTLDTTEELEGHYLFFPDELELV